MRADDEYIPLLYPFWGYQLEPEGFIDRGRFLEYVSVGEAFFGITNDLSRADVVLSPLAFERERGPEAAAYFSDIAKTANKKVIIFFASDSDREIDIPNSIIFRTSFYKSQQRSHEHALPGWSVDFLKAYNGGRMILKKKEKKPVVGYCGYIDHSSIPSGVGLHFYNLKRSFKYLLRRCENTAYFKRLRGDAVRYLCKSKRISANIVIRQKYRGRELPEAFARIEYFRNMVDSDYSLVVRGAGNFSYRLYEVLSCGRIPVFVDTDCVLPFDDIIDWKQHCVWIEEKEIRNIGRIVANFHNDISSAEFEELQIRNRRLYERWLSPVGFFGNIYRYIVSE